MPCLFAATAWLLFRSNMADFKVHENTQLLVQFRDNILAIINAMEAMSGVIAQMPQLHVRWVGLARRLASRLHAACSNLLGWMRPQLLRQACCRYTQHSCI